MQASMRKLGHVVIAVLVCSTLVAAADDTAAIARAVPAIALPASARLEMARFVVIYRTTADLNLVAEFFDKNMPEAGWHATNETPFSSEDNLPQRNFEKGSFTASIILTAGDRWQQVMIGIARNEDQSIRSGSTARLMQSLPAVGIPASLRLDKIRCSLFYRSALPSPPLMKFFRKSLSTNGWTGNQAAEEGQISGEKEGYAAMAAVTAQSEGSKIFVSIAKTEPRSIMERPD